MTAKAAVIKARVDGMMHELFCYRQRICGIFVLANTLCVAGATRPCTHEINREPVEENGAEKNQFGFENGGEEFEPRAIESPTQAALVTPGKSDASSSQGANWLTTGVLLRPIVY